MFFFVSLLKFDECQLQTELGKVLKQLSHYVSLFFGFISLLMLHNDTSIAFVL